jgi:hypothetical protein
MTPHGTSQDTPVLNTIASFGALRSLDVSDLVATRRANRILERSPLAPASLATSPAPQTPVVPLHSHIRPAPPVQSRPRGILLPVRKVGQFRAAAAQWCPPKATVLPNRAHVIMPHMARPPSTTTATPSSCVVLGVDNSTPLQRLGSLVVTRHGPYGKKQSSKNTLVCAHVTCGIR